MPMDLNQLSVLDALLRTESTVEAARILGVSQSAVSHALRKLRARFDDRLLVRVGGRLVKTERARALQEPLADALAAATRVFEPLTAVEPTSLRATFRIGAADYGELVVLPALLERLSAEAPGVDLVVQSVGDAAEHALESGQLDLVIGARFRERAGLLFRGLQQDPLVCVEQARNGLRSMDLERFLGGRHVLVSPRGLPGGIVDDALAALGRTRRIVLTTPSFQTALAVASRTGLFTTVPHRLAEAYAGRALLRLHPIPLSLPRIGFGLLFSRSRQNDPAHRWLRACIAGLFTDESLQ